MLALTRRAGEEIVIGDPDNPLGIIRVVDIRGDKVRLSFAFPRDIKINRSELAEQKRSHPEGAQTPRPGDRSQAIDRKNGRPRPAGDAPVSSDPRIVAFLSGGPHAVIGASADREKYGNKVLRVFQQTGRPAFAVNPNADTVEGQRAYPDLSALPEPVYGLSIITPPAVTEWVVADALTRGVRQFWMQPGAESEAATRMCQDAGANVIPGDACILVVLGYRE